MEKVFDLNQFATQFFHTRIGSCLSRLKQEKLIVGDYNPKPVDSTGSFISSFEFLESWAISISFVVKKQKIDDFILNAISLSNDDKNSLEYGVHYHPQIVKRASWECLEIFETGWHMHFGKDEYKLLYGEDDEFEILPLLAYIAARHDCNVHKKIFAFLRRTEPSPPVLFISPYSSSVA